MTFAAALTQIETHVAAAGSAINNPITDAQIGYPLPKGRCIRVFYDGEDESEQSGERMTLTHNMVGERVLIVAFWPLSTSGEDFAANTEAEVWELKDEIRTRIDGDHHLGGQCDGLDLEYATTDIVQIGGGWWRTLEMTCLLAFLEPYTIAT
jgi:hypothetical protein